MSIKDQANSRLNKMQGEQVKSPSDLMFGAEELKADLKKNDNKDKANEKEKNTKSKNDKMVANPSKLSKKENDQYVKKPTINKSKKVEDTHTRATFLVHNELLDRLNKAANKGGHGWKIKFINYAIQNTLNELESDD